MTLIVIAMLLVTGASGAYGYFFIYESNDSEEIEVEQVQDCLLYTSPSPRDATLSRMPSSA